MGLQNPYGPQHTYLELEYFLQRLDDDRYSSGGKTSHDAEMPPLLAMRANHCASGYDDGGATWNGGVSCEASEPSLSFAGAKPWACGAEVGRRTEWWVVRLSSRVLLP